MDLNGVFACIGDTLRDLIGTKLTEDQLLDYFTQIAIILKPLHDMNLAFGHVHPGNFFFDRSKKCRQQIVVHNFTTGAGHKGYRAPGR